VCLKRNSEVSIDFVPTLNGISSVLSDRGEYIQVAHMESTRRSESGKLRCRMALGYDAGTRIGMTCGIARINRQLQSVVSGPLGLMFNVNVEN
jgi:hypothetical protein